MFILIWLSAHFLLNRSFSFSADFILTLNYSQTTNHFLETQTQRYSFKIYDKRSDNLHEFYIHRTFQ
jgi:hypothetical protein